MMKITRLIYTITACIILLTALTQPRCVFSQYNQGDASVKILFLGDLDFGESYQINPLYNRGVNIIDEYGYDYMFENISELLLNSDYTIANLETPLIDSITSGASARKVYVHWSSADKTIDYLKKYNISAFSLANNHTFDYGTEGLSQTISIFQKFRLDYFGAGMNIEETAKPLIKQFIRNNDTLTIAVLNGFEYRKSYDSIYNFYAKENLPGVNVISVERITKQIKEIKEKYRNVYIICFPHWGRNYYWKTDKQTETAHSLIDAGIDLIIGHGAHMMQETEYYNGHWIVYSIGNSVFNAPGRYRSFDAKPYSFIAGLIVRNNSKDIEKHLRLYPIFTDNLETDYQVRFLNTDEMNDCYLILKDKSSDKEIFEDEFRIKENDGLSFFEIQLN